MAGLMTDQMTDLMTHGPPHPTALMSVLYQIRLLGRVHAVESGSHAQPLNPAHNAL